MLKCLYRVTTHLGLQFGLHVFGCPLQTRPEVDKLFLTRPLFHVKISGHTLGVHTGTGRALAQQNRIVLQSLVGLAQGVHCGRGNLANWRVLGVHRPVGPDEDVVDGTREEDQQAAGCGEADEETRVLLNPGALLHAIRPVLLRIGRVASLVHRSAVQLRLVV